MKASKTRGQLKSGAAPSSEKHIQRPDSFPTAEQIRQRAYEIYEARDGGLGNELNDLFQAQLELLAERERPIGSNE